MAVAIPGYAHPYFTHGDPERRWLYQLILELPSLLRSYSGGSVGGSNLLNLNAQSVTVPSAAVDVITIPHLNQDVKVAGRPTLGEMSVTFLSSYNINSVRILEAWHRNIYRPSTEMLNYASQYKTNGSLVVYTPTFGVFKAYKIMGAWPSSIGDKEYDWSASESVTRVVTFQVDKVLDDDDGGSAGINEDIAPF